MRTPPVDRWQGIGHGILFALCAAILFGLSTPLAKILLASMTPLALASLLYLGSGLGTAMLIPFRYLLKERIAPQKPLERGDLWLFFASVIAGGVIAPGALMFGLERTPASTASLLMNFEAAATGAIAFALFHERPGKRLGVAILILTLAASLLSIRHEGEWAISAGALLVVISCILWGLDNNITGILSVKDPIEIAAIKGVIAGACLLLLSLSQGLPAAAPGTIAAALLLGAVSYGISIVLYILAMRALGAVRACSFFSLAPFAGAGLSILLLQERIDIWFVLALLLMAVGVRLLVQEHRLRS
ncbi:MAG: DMT family transporter [Methanomicrobiales archaeon]|nr:DMT family transporter [Methanomicrobiales archaeon]